MTRDEMLEKLSKVKFEMIWPGAWSDIGFTEREIWVNSKGYGYIMCDEVTGYFIGDGIEGEKWAVIRAKLEEDELKAEDIEGTSIEEMIEQFFWWDTQEVIDDGKLYGLLDLPNEAPKEIYCLQTDDGPEFYKTQEEMDHAYERDWCDVSWEELEDGILAEWIERLF